MPRMPQETPPGVMSVGELSARSGVAASALRFYEAEGLLRADRSTGHQRRYPRSALRRVAFVRAAQRVGLSLDEIREALDALPGSRTPTKGDWTLLSRRWRNRLTQQIENLEMLRDNLDGCIGCGCLSMRQCSIYNPQDRAADRGAGARYLLGDEPADVIHEI